LLQPELGIDFSLKVPHLNTRNSEILMDVIAFHVSKSTNFILRLMVIVGVSQPPVKGWVPPRDEFAESSIERTTGHLNAGVPGEVLVCKAHRSFAIEKYPVVTIQIVLHKSATILVNRLTTQSCVQLI
jgi:hypothetical protein